MRLALRELRPDVTVHGFRATLRSWAGGCTSYPHDICEAALGHAIGNAVVQAYMRDALLAKRRVLMSDWAEFCAKPSASVVRLDVGGLLDAAQSHNISKDSDGGTLRQM
jgi:hypothetical protein